MSQPYDPTLAGLLENVYDEWGDRETNMKNVVPYGVSQFDRDVYGLDLNEGEVAGIEGREKHRKTSVLFNFILAWSRAMDDRNFWICADTLESGMTSRAYRNGLVAIAATRLMVAKVLGQDDRRLWPSVREIRQRLGREMIISRKFFKYGRWTELQKWAIDTAVARLKDLPITIWGNSLFTGGTRSLEKTLERWDALYKGEYETVGDDGKKLSLVTLQHRIFCADNIQLYRGFGSNKFEQQETVVAQMADFVGTHPGSAVVLLSQMGQGSLADETRGVRKATAKGGTALEAEATILFRVKYDNEVNPHQIELWVDVAREKVPPRVYQDIDLESGAFLADAFTEKVSLND